MKVFAISVNFRKSDSLVLTSSHADTHTHVGLFKGTGRIYCYILFFFFSCAEFYRIRVCRPRGFIASKFIGIWTTKRSWVTNSWTVEAKDLLSRLIATWSSNTRPLYYRKFVIVLTKSCRNLLMASHPLCLLVILILPPYTRPGSSRATAYNFVINLLFLCAAFPFCLVPFVLLVIYLTALSVTWSL